jgi:hypothetical protein
VHEVVELVDENKYVHEPPEFTEEALNRKRTPEQSSDVL